MSNRALMIVTCVATLFLPLQQAIFFGVALSFAVFAYRESESTTVVEAVTAEKGYVTEKPVPDDLPSDRVTRLNIYGSLFFARARNLKEDLPEVDKTHNLVNVSHAAHEQLLRTDFLSVIGDGNVFLVSERGETTRQANEQAQQLILAREQQANK